MLLALSTDAISDRGKQFLDSKFLPESDKGFARRLDHQKYTWTKYD